MVENPYQSPSELSESPVTTRSALSRDVVLQGSMPVRDVWHTQILILSRRWHYALLCFVMYVSFVLLLSMLDSSESLFGSTIAVLGLMLMPAILPFTLLMVYLRLTSDAKRKVGVFAVTKTLLTNDGIQSSMNEEDVSIPWSSFSSFTHSKRVALLFISESNDHLIVSRAKLSNPGDWSMLIDFLHARFPSSS